MKALKLRNESPSETLISVVAQDERKYDSTEDPPIKRWGRVWRNLQDTARILSIVNSSDLPRETSPEEIPTSRENWEAKTKEWIR